MSFPSKWFNLDGLLNHIMCDFRDLDHDNVVHYYGSTLKVSDGKGRNRLFWIMIMEYCLDTMKGMQNFGYEHYC